MLFHQARIFTFLMGFLLLFWNFLGISRGVFAQSILSDRVWLEQKIKVFIKKNLTYQNGQLRLSSMMHAPLIFNQSVASPFLPEKPKLLYPKELQSTPFLSKIQTDDLTYESSISKLGRIFTGNTSIEQTTADNEANTNQKDQDWANNEFSDISMPVAEIEDLIFSDPVAARVKYLEFEDW